MYVHIPEKIDGKPKWPVRKEFILTMLDKYKRLVHNHFPTRRLNNNIFSWLGMSVAEKDFNRLIKMGLVKKENGARRNFYVLAKPLEKVPVQEPREPYKKRKLAIAELNQSIMKNRKGKQHERVSQSIYTSSNLG